MNRLQHESSPYLRQHAGNPVDWYPWGPEALQRAVDTDTPILLSVGYSACHWCHVMAHESFEDERVAAAMNQGFINIKVDREERPDLDQLYQGVAQLTGRGGGWPLTVFLTPGLRPFFGGTYFPPGPRHGLPGFGDLVTGLSTAWRERRSEVEAQADAFHEGLTELSTLGLEGAPGAWSSAELVDAAERLASVVDPRHGGFGSTGPKFPNAMALAAMLRGWRRGANDSVRRAVWLTLEKMAHGGVFDQLGGGFHRYSVDERWVVPHFEKMLYDSAQLIHLYAEAHRLHPTPLFQRVVEQSVAWLERECRAPGGGFVAAHDADSEGEEGRFFVWTPRELDEVLSPEEAALAKRAWGVTEHGNFEHGATILTVVEPLEGLETIRAKLFEARRRRVSPGVDDKVLAGWNGLAIRGLSYAARVFSRPEWAKLATDAATFVVERMMRPDGSLYRSVQRGVPKHDGVLEDAGQLASGLVALFQVTFDPRWLEAAERIVDAAVKRFWDDEKTAWRMGSTELLVPTYSVHDNALPSGASAMCEAQVVLSALTGRPRHVEHANRFLEKLKQQMLENPLGFGHALVAVDVLLDGAAEVAILGEAPLVDALLAEVERHWAPTLSLIVHRGGAVPPVLAEVLAQRPGRGAFLCQHFSCQMPVFTPAALSQSLTAGPHPFAVSGRALT